MTHRLDLYAKYRRKAAAAFANRAILAATNTALNAMPAANGCPCCGANRLRVDQQPALMAHRLPTVLVTCEVCKNTWDNRDTLTEEAKARIWDGVVAKLEAGE